MLVRVANYCVVQGRAAAERLAESRGQVMSDANVEIVRRAMDAFNQSNVLVAGDPPGCASSGGLC